MMTIVISEFWAGFAMGAIASLLFMLALGSWASRKNSLDANRH